MKIAKIISKIILYSAKIYIAVFAVWILLANSCVQKAEQYGSPVGNVCGQDNLTALVRTTHAPLLALMFGSNSSK